MLVCHDCGGFKAYGPSCLLPRRAILHSAVGKFGEPAAVAWVNRAMGGPLPAAKFGALVIHEDLLQFSAAVHDEGAVMGHRFIDRAAL